jgi:predicted 2-oxoglutarate/Fe(II)-dependent dioxygenase YbiX
MVDHAIDILNLTFWIIGALGALIVILFVTGLGVVKWAVSRYEKGAEEAQKKLNDRLDVQDDTLKSIKDFMAKELYELREWFHRLDKDVLLIKEQNYRRRQSDYPETPRQNEP